MSTRALNWVWELDGLGPSETLVLLALADQANDAGLAWPAQGSLARRARQTDRNVRRMLVRLQRMGLVSVERRSSTGGRRSNRYLLHIGAQIEGSLESRQEDNLSGCGQVVDDVPVDNSAGEGLSVGVAATGQSVLLRKRTDCPVVQEDTGVRSQPDTDVRLLPIWEPPLEPPDRTGPGGGLSAREPGVGRVRSGRERPGPSSRASDRAAPGAARRASTSTPSSGLSGEDRRLLAECLPGRLLALDAVGASRVVGLLRERLAAGWSPAQIRQVMDQPLPDQVGRLSSLVASRLVRNVDPNCAPLPVASVESMGDDARWERARRRSEELAGGVRRDPGEDLMGRALAQVRAEAPEVGRAEQARRAAELVQRWAQGVAS